MKCQDIINLLSPYLEGELERKERVELEVHLQDCQACQKELNLLEATINSLKNLEELVPPVELLVKINEEIDKRSLQFRLNFIWEKLSLPIKAPTLVKSLAFAASILLIIYLVVGPGQMYFTPLEKAIDLSRQQQIGSVVSLPSQIALEERAEPELAIPQPAANIPRPGRYCMVPAKMAEMKEIYNLGDFYFPNPKGMAEVRKTIGSYKN